MKRSQLNNAIARVEAFILNELETREASMLPDPTGEEADYTLEAKRAAHAIQIVKKAVGT